MKKRNWFQISLFVFPAIIGTIGFLISRACTLQDALFRCITMYVLNYGETPPNIMVEIARWLAPVATASGILFAISAVKENIRNLFRYLRGGSIAVYGPAAEREPYLRELGRTGIRGEEKFVKAERYILLDNEESNIAFYTKNQEKLKKRMVYFKSEMLPSQNSFSAFLIPFSREEVAARLFWKEHCIYHLARDSAFTMHIVFLGFGLLGDELLYWGLQENIFSPAQTIQYHVFGDCDSFLATHPYLNQISDSIRYHPELWNHSVDVLQTASLIIVLEQQNQLKILRDLKRILPGASVIVFCERDDLSVFEREFFGCETFLWKEKTSVVQNVLNDEINRLAKSINLRYQHIYTGIEETTKNLESEWQKLDAFTRMSNISAADYHEIRTIMLKDIAPKSNEIDAQTLELLSELEHIRWCRYHYLNNWKYGNPDNGKAKDPVRQIHKDLRPYAELSEAEKEKDRENIRVLLSVPCIKEKGCK